MPAPSNELEQVLFHDGEPVPVDEIRIAIVAGCQFRWSLWSGGEEIYAGLGDVDQVAGMTRATEQLVNTQLGVSPAVGTPRHSLN